MSASRRHYSQGFSLIELIIIIIILGVISVVAVPRFQDTSGYAEYALQNRLIASLRHFQIRAMQDARANFCYRINFDKTANDASYGPAVANYATATPANSCQNTIDFTAPDYLRTQRGEISQQNLTLAVTDNSTAISFIGFDGMGRPVTSASNCSNACKVSFIGESTAAVCIESQGYVHACD